MYALYSTPPTGLKFNSILHVMDPAVFPALKNKIMQDYIYTTMSTIKVGLAIVIPRTLTEYNTVVVHDTPNRHKFWTALQKEQPLLDRMVSLLKSSSGTYIGIGFGGEIVQKNSTELVQHANSKVTTLTTPMLGGLNKRILLNYKRLQPTRTMLLDISRQGDIWAFPPGTGYDSNKKTLFGKGIFLYRKGSEYYVTENKEISSHSHANIKVLDQLSEQEGRLTYGGTTNILTWQSVAW